MTITDPVEHARPDADPLPVRMLNEFAYCPRLSHLMHVEGCWADNTYTIEGRHIHRRVDKLDHVLPGQTDSADQRPESTDHPADADELDQPDPSPPDKPGKGDEPPDIARSVPLASTQFALTAKLDLVSVDDQADPPEAVPVETKRGRVPQTPERSYEPERVQLMAQGLILREHGYHCDHGVLYFAGSRTRVDVAFTDELEQRTRELITEAHVAARSTTLPPPLDDSPKCRGCSLSGICLPDETLALRQTCHPHPDGAREIRRFYPARDEAVPLYVQEQGAVVGKKANMIIIRKEGRQVAKARLRDISQLVLCGNIQVSTQTLHQLCEADTPVIYLSTGHWFYGVTTGLGLKNAFNRAAQFQAAADASRALAFAKHIVADKATNQRAFLRRNGAPDAATSRDINDLIDRIGSAQSIQSLLGLEGSVARHYFQAFSSMLKPRELSGSFDFASRNRRPPRDPINALLSFAYAMLVKECAVALIGEGLDPHWGLYHQPRHGRPALALDIMEPLRPLIADSAVITAVNTGMVRSRHFQIGNGACILHPAGRKAIIQAYEARLDQLVTHPAFDYRCTWRAAIRLHARLLARWLRGDVPAYQSITTR